MDEGREHSKMEVREEGVKIGGDGERKADAVTYRGRVSIREEDVQDRKRHRENGGAGLRSMVVFIIIFFQKRAQRGEKKAFGQA